MPRVYSAADLVTTTSTTADLDLCEVNAGSNKTLQILKFTAVPYTEEGDAEAEMVILSIYRASGSAASGGASIAGLPRDPSDSADSATVEFGNTTAAGTTDSTDLLEQEAFNVQAGYFHRPTPDERITVPSGGDPVVFRLSSASDNLADNMSIACTIVYVEIG